MSFWRRIITIAVLLGLVLAVVWAIRSRDEEPFYHGKSLTQWLKIYLSSDDASPEEARAEAAVRAIGTNGIPFLVRCVGYEASPWKRRWQRVVNTTVGRVNRSWRLTDAMQEKQMNALTAFVILESSAKSAVPELNEIMKSGGPLASHLAGQALGCIGEPGLAALLPALQGDRESLALDASRVIAGMETNGWAAVPVLISQLGDPREAIRLRAAVTLGELHHDAEAVVPALMRFYGPSNNVRYCVLSALEEFGTNAQMAVPLVMGALSDTNASVRMAATNALRGIAPEVLTDGGR